MTNSNWYFLLFLISQALDWTYSESEGSGGMGSPYRWDLGNGDEAKSLWLHDKGNEIIATGWIHPKIRRILKQYNIPIQKQ